MEPEITDIRPMIEADVLRADELRRIVGWNQRPGDWRRILTLEPRGCFVATAGDELIGTVTTTAYGTTLAWIGMMLVHPEHRRKGLATRLMNRALEYLEERHVQCVKLDATPAGQPVYTRLGFITECTLQRWERESDVAAPAEAPVTWQIRELREDDWPQVVRADAAAFGAPRPALLRRFADESRCKLVWPAKGNVLGFGLLRSGATSDYLGPLICDVEGLKMLLPALVFAARGRSVTWDIPDRNEPAQIAAQQYGFKPVRPLTRMRLGPQCDAPKPETLVGIADPAVG